MVTRQLPKPAELLELMQFKKPELDGRKRRLDAALTIYDLRKIAKRRTPKAAFDYTDGAAEGELSLARARQAFEDIEFHPGILRPAVDVDTSVEILGGPSALPFGIAPTGFTRLDADRGRGGRGRRGRCRRHPVHALDARHDIDRGCQEGEPPRAQLVPAVRHARTRDLVRPRAPGCRSRASTRCMFTVDTPIAGARLRDKRNGFSIPPQLTIGTIINAIPRPWWWYDFLTTPKLEFASLSSTGGTVGELLDAAMDPTISYDDLAVIRDIWPGKIVVKGVQNVEDSVRLIDAGVDGIILSNHGGRQLDRAPIPFHLLPNVVREVGKDATVMIDTGIMNGADIVASIALGAKFTLVGRAYLYGLMAGGRQGVDRTIEILKTEIVRTMSLLGVSSLAELEPKHVTQLARLVPIAQPAGSAPSAARTARARASAAKAPAKGANPAPPNTDVR